MPAEPDLPPRCPTCGRKMTWECIALPSSTRPMATSGDGHYDWVCLPCRWSQHRDAILRDTAAVRAKEEQDKVIRSYVLGLLLLLGVVACLTWLIIFLRR